MTNESDRFGVPDVNLHAAEEAVKRQKKYNLQSYVPTRHEVATLGIEKMMEMLTAWMCHSPTEIIPSRAQIAEVKLILLERPDASELAGLVNMCDRYIDGDFN